MYFFMGLFKIILVYYLVYLFCFYQNLQYLMLGWWLDMSFYGVLITQAVLDSDGILGQSLAFFLIRRLNW